MAGGFAFATDRTYATAAFNSIPYGLFYCPLRGRAFPISAGNEKLWKRCRTGPAFMALLLTSRPFTASTNLIISNTLWFFIISTWLPGRFYRRGRSIPARRSSLLGRSLIERTSELSARRFSMRGNRLLFQGSATLNCNATVTARVCARLIVVYSKRNAHDERTNEISNGTSQLIRRHLADD